MKRTKLHAVLKMDSNVSIYNMNLERESYDYYLHKWFLFMQIF